MEAKKIFGKELWGTLYTIAKDVKIQVEFNPAVVSSYRLIGYENRMLQTEDFNNDKKDAGDIGSGHTVTALYEITLADQNTNKLQESKYVKQTYTNNSEIMTVNIRYKKPSENTSLLISETIKKDALTKGPNIDFAASVAEFGMILRNSEQKGLSTYSHVIETVKKIETNDNWGYRSEFITLVEKASQLDKQN